MAPFFPLSLRSKLLLLQLEAQCDFARRFLLQRRLVSNSTKPRSTEISLGVVKKIPKPLPPPQFVQPKGNEVFTPEPLKQPLGFLDPPLPGENTGLDPRDWRTRRDDFFDYDKHLERRRQLTKQVAKSYFRDWSNMRFQKGKVFLAPERLLRSDKALYFPNLWGFTLATPKDERDTTPVLHGRISLVAVYTGTWAEQQTKTFLEGNELLNSVMGAGQEFIQRVDINIEQNRMKASLVKLFMGGIRRNLPTEQHGKYFLVTQGLTDEMREKMGIFNSQVGYIYLLDSECRIRWAGSAEALPQEKDSMIKGVGRLAKELKQKTDKSDIETDDLASGALVAIRAGADRIAAMTQS